MIYDFILADHGSMYLVFPDFVEYVPSYSCLTQGAVLLVMLMHGCFPNDIVECYPIILLFKTGKNFFCTVQKVFSCLICSQQLFAALWLYHPMLCITDA